MAAKKKAAASTTPRAPKKKGPPTRGKRKPQPKGSAGLAPAESAKVNDGKAQTLAGDIEKDGGAVLAQYLDPLFGKPVVFAVLPLDKVERTPFQRDVSESHVDKMVDAMKRTGAYLDPVIAVRNADGVYRSPNGGHRLAALNRLGAKSVVALVLPDERLAFKILALNTEKAHALKEKALEAIRMLKALAPFGGKEEQFAGELEEPALCTIGAAYEKRPRFSGSAYAPITKRADGWLDVGIEQAVAERAKRADKLLALDDAVQPIIDAIKARGIDSPGLRQVVLSRVAPLPKKGEKLEGSFEQIIDKCIERAENLDPDSIQIGAGAMIPSGGDEE